MPLGPSLILPTPPPALWAGMAVWAGLLHLERTRRRWEREQRGPSELERLEALRRVCGAIRPRSRSMSLIFDRFPSPAAAAAFVVAARERFEVLGQVFTSAEAANAHDPFPLVLGPPIVHLDRTDEATERELEELVRPFGGTFAGT